MTLNADEIIEMLFDGVPKHKGWFIKGERYQIKEQVWVILYDTPKNNITVSVRMYNADGTVFDKGSSKRGVMAHGLRDLTPIKD